MNTASDPPPPAASESAALHDHGLSTEEASERLRRDGPNEIKEEPHHPWRLFLKKFWGLSAWMIEAMALLSLALGKYNDLWVSLFLLVTNALLSFFQEEHAATAVAALRQRLEVTARVLRDGAWRPLPAREIVKGDRVRVRAGDFVPADMNISDGVVRVDQSVLTGESQATEKHASDVLYSGSIVNQGEASGIVTETGQHTYFGRTAKLIETAKPRFHVDRVISRVVRWLTGVVGLLIALAFGVSILQGVPLLESLPIGLVVLMSAIPIALPVMFTVSTALGSVELADKGVLITRLNAVEDAATMDVLCVDKTGTLTQNKLVLVNALPQPGFSATEVIRAGALASEVADYDPIDLAFLQAAKERQALDGTEQVLSFLPFSAATRCTQATVRVRDDTFRCAKGALDTIAQMAGLGPRELQLLEQIAEAQASKGIRTLAVARAESSASWQLIGLVCLYDAPRPDSRHFIDELHGLHIQVKMLTGDAWPVAQEIAHELGLGDIARAQDLRADNAQSVELATRADGFAEVFPEDKYHAVKRLQAAGHIVGMTGDGVNDAPALRQAEVGIAVLGSTDVAKSAASAALTTEGLSNIVELVRVGRAIYQRVLTWIVNKVADTILKAGLIVIAFLTTGRFVISALGMLLVVLLTDFVKVALATDRVEASELPETWNIEPLIGVSVALGLLMLAEALVLLAVGWFYFGLAHAEGRTLTFTFQLLLFFALFSLISLRERRHFWASRPSMAIVAALIAGALIGMLVGYLGAGRLEPLPLDQSILLMACIGALALGPNDALKRVLTRQALRKMQSHRLPQR